MNPVTLAVVLFASFYGPGYDGRTTASGTTFRSTEMTCASWDYPFGTRLRVTNTETGFSVIVTVTDRGPAKHLRAKLDLSQSAFAKLAPLERGIILVRVEPLPATETAPQMPEKLPLRPSEALSGVRVAAPSSGP